MILIQCAQCGTQLTIKPEHRLEVWANKAGNKERQRRGSGVCFS